MAFDWFRINRPRGSLGGTQVICVIGFIAALVGTLVYLTDRDASRSMLIPSIAWLAGRDLFGAFGGSLPSFAHTFAFSLFTGAGLGVRASPRYEPCIGWFVVNAVFEIGQHPLVSGRVADWQVGRIESMWTDWITRYFTRGTFDAFDILAALFGAIAAAVVLRLVQRRIEANHAS